jgi:hypothetical protein
VRITVHQVAEHRLGKTGDLSGTDYAKAGFPDPLGACEICETELVSRRQAYPSLTGNLRCPEHIYDSGWDDLIEANEALVGGPLFKDPADHDERWAFYEGGDDE